MKMVLDIATLAASIVTVLGFVTSIYFALKWFSTPRFIIGVVPSPEEMTWQEIKDIGSRSLFDEIVFSKSLLARRVGREKQLAKVRKHKKSLREVRVEDGEIALPVIVQNIGRREAGSYTIGVAYSNPDIHLVDLKTETLEISGAYVQDEKLLKSRDLSQRNPAEEIRETYKQLGLTRDYLSLSGGLGSYTFEMMWLRLKLPRECSEFFIIFRVDCPDSFIKRRTYAQFIKVIKR